MRNLKQWHLVVGLLGLGLVLLAVLLAAIPESRYIVIQVAEGLKFLIWDVIVTIILLAAMTLGPAVLSYFVRNKLSDLDDEVEDDKEFGGWFHLGMSVIFGAVLGFVWMIAVPWIVSWSTGVQFTWELLGASTLYESLPLGWGVLGFAMFFIGYWMRKMGEAMGF